MTNTTNDTVVESDALTAPVEHKFEVAISSSARGIWYLLLIRTADNALFSLRRNKHTKPGPGVFKTKAAATAAAKRVREKLDAGETPNLSRYWNSFAKGSEGYDRAMAGIQAQF